MWVISHLHDTGETIGGSQMERSLSVDITDADVRTKIEQILDYIWLISSYGHQQSSLGYKGTKEISECINNKSIPWGIMNLF